MNWKLQNDSVQARRKKIWKHGYKHNEQDKKQIPR